MKHATILVICLSGAAILGGCGKKKADDAGGSVSGGAGGSAVATLSEGEIVGVVLGVSNALAAADSAAIAMIESPGINRYAVVMRADHRAIAQEMRAVADTIKVTGLQSATAERLRSEAAAITTLLADTAVDRASAFVDAQVLMQRHLLGAMDSVLIPGSRTPALRQVLTDLRPAMVAHLQRAEQLKQILATSETAGPRVAARISPDSARAPGDTTGADAKTAAKPVVKPDSVKPDTIRTYM